MSGKLTLDTVAGGSVTLTVDDTETGDIEYALDSAGIESDTGVDGNYVKYPDGTLIWYGALEEDTIFTTASGALWRSQSATFSASFAEIPFIGRARITASIRSLDGESDVDAIGIQTFNQTLTDTNFIVYSTTNTARFVRLSWIAIGRWK